MKTYTFKYGKTTVDAPLDEAQVLAELHGHETPPLEDIGATLLEAVEHPIESLPLRAYAKTGDKVALIVSDMTRFWMRQDLVIPYLVRFLEEECGIPDEDLTIVVANGTHAGGDEKTLRTLVTDAVYDRVKVVNHDCQADDLVDLGTTTRGTEVRVNRIAAEADKVICLGACTHHVMAGFGGGRKSILPGISS
ncbi:MAG TPA: lactate racemase domain-containing protein, partial [Oscillospiraceae bacterium]|nr:lactate racemase domain-containing protein [Oscillospiraceae bacterium]